VIKIHFILIYYNVRSYFFCAQILVTLFTLFQPRFCFKQLNLPKKEEIDTSTIKQKLLPQNKVCLVAFKRAIMIFIMVLNQTRKHSQRVLSIFCALFGCCFINLSYLLLLREIFERDIHFSSDGVIVS
jgi:hypothetical protein